MSERQTCQKRWDLQGLFQRNRKFLTPNPTQPRRHSSAQPSNESKNDLSTKSPSEFQFRSSSPYADDSAQFGKQPPVKALEFDDTYMMKLQEFLSTSLNFHKHFYNSEDRMNKLVQLDCNRQQQRVLYGAISPNRRSAIQNKCLTQQDSTSTTLHSESATLDTEEKQTISQESNSRPTSAQERKPARGTKLQKGLENQQKALPLRVILNESQVIPRSPTPKFNLQSGRKDLFAEKLKASNSVEKHFNNFEIISPKIEHTIDFNKSTNRRYDVFDCNISQYKYTNANKVYLRNRFSSQNQKCLVDFSKMNNSSEREFYIKPSLTNITTIDSELLSKGINATLPFRKLPTPNMKKSMGREMKQSNINALLGDEIQIGKIAMNDRPSSQINRTRDELILQRGRPNTAMSSRKGNFDTTENEKHKKINLSDNFQSNGTTSPDQQNRKKSTRNTIKKQSMEEFRKKFKAVQKIFSQYSQ